MPAGLKGFLMTAVAPPHMPSVLFSPISSLPGEGENQDQMLVFRQYGKKRGERWLPHGLPHLRGVQAVLTERAMSCPITLK